MRYVLLRLYVLSLSTNMVPSKMYALLESMRYESYALRGSRLYLLQRNSSRVCVTAHVRSHFRGHSSPWILRSRNAGEGLDLGGGLGFRCTVVGSDGTSDGTG
jgi:hypothetical protein